MKLRLLGLAASVMLSAFNSARADTITGVAFSGSPVAPTISIFGSGFGTAPDPTIVAFPGFTGYDYGSALYFEDLSPATGFQAGYGFAGAPTRDYIGLVLLTYTNTLIQYQLGSTYADYYYPIGLYQLNAGDSFFLHTDADYTGVVSFNNTSSTPEPASWLLLASGAMLLTQTRRHRKSRAAQS